MNVLWVVNTVFPDAARHLGLQPPVFGGWMYGMAADLALIVDVKLAVATVYPGDEFQAIDTNGIRYYLIPNKSGSRHHRGDYWHEVVRDFQPDLVHIHGTEYAHGMALMNAFPNLRCVVSIQGLVSVCHRYYMAGIGLWDVIRSITLRDVLRLDTIFHGRHNFFVRGKLEREYIRRASGVIGRTDWDYAHVKAINPGVSYYFCNESLRDEFYSGDEWSYQSCEKHTIFLSQASYPIKGLHQVLKAVAIVKQHFPYVKVRVAGPDIIGDASWRMRLRLSGYGKYVRRLIKDLGLDGVVTFMGAMDAKAMRSAYLSSNVFVCPSSIENSPNSLGEAQILGVPTIASYVGGVPSMNSSDSCLFYPFEEPEMLACLIKSVFDNAALATRVAGVGKVLASKRHDRAENLNSLLTIYSAH